MGTDIHLCVEAMTYDEHTRAELGWELIEGPIEDCQSCEGTGISRRWTDRNERVPDPDGKPCSWCNPAAHPRITDDPDEAAYWATRFGDGVGRARTSWYDERNYTVFAVLGDVRNGTGFAGMRTHSRIEPLPSHRGLPDDMSDAARHWFEHRGGDHSDNWLMLEEVLRYNWDAPIHRTGVLTLAEWAEYRKHGEPHGWSSDISGSAVQYVDPTEMDRQLALFQQRFGGSPARLMDPRTDVTYCCRVQWTTSIAPAATRFLERMRLLAQTVGERPCRLLFNFDS